MCIEPNLFSTGESRHPSDSQSQQSTVPELWDAARFLFRSHRASRGFAEDCGLAGTRLKQRNADRALWVQLVSLSYFRA